MQQPFALAQQAHQQGRLEEAIAGYREAIAQTPRMADAHHLLGVALSQQGKHAEGAASIRQAVELQPANYMYYNNLGLVHFRLGEYELALNAFRAVTRIAPKFADAWFNMGNVYKAQEQTEEAIKYYEKALKTEPRHERAAYNLGNTLLAQGKAKSARQWFEKAIAIKPNYAEAHNNLGSALEAWNEYEAALNCFAKAVALSPNFTDALKNLGNAHLRKGSYAEGRRLIYESLVRKTQTGWEDLILASLAPIIFDDRPAIEHFFGSLTGVLEAYTAKSLPIDLATLHEMRLEPASGMPYQGVDIKPILELYGKVFSQSLPTLTIPARMRNPRPRIGFVVTNGHEGVFMKCMSGILNQFDTLRFDVTVVCNLPNGPEILRPAIVNPAVQFLGIPARIDQAIQKIAAANFDALHYWEVGTDAQNYFLPFFRLAPVQCATWGWPTTTGIPNMDYFLSSEGLETPDAEAHYTEKLVRFRKLPTYYYRPLVPAVLADRASFDLPEEQHLYLMVQNLRKVHPDFDAILADLLAKDPDGWVLLIDDAHAEVTDLLKARLINACGANANRLRFMPRMEAERYLNLLAVVDVILDTLYYTGGANTSYDAFAVGTPYVTLPTTFHRGRYGAAAYRQIGVEDTITSDTADYVGKAIRIATDRAFRADLSGRIRANAHKVFEDHEAVRELENFFSQAIS